MYEDKTPTMALLFASNSGNNINSMMHTMLSQNKKTLLFKLQKKSQQIKQLIRTDTHFKRHATTMAQTTQIIN